MKIAGLLRLAFDERRTFHVSDMASEEVRVLIDSPRSPEDWATLYGASQRSRLAVPVLYDGAAIGVIRVHRTEPGGFTPQQIGLVESFAAQAAIAIRNVRLFTETKESLDRQTATAEVLKVISRSAQDLQPVFRVILETATRLSGTPRGAIFVREGDLLRSVVHIGLPPERAAHFDAHPTRKITMDDIPGRVFLTREAVHAADAWDDPRSGPGDRARPAIGPRTVLAIPMVKAGQAIGVIALTRDEVRPFSPSDISLVTTFADQAAIAIENVRLFNETKEALEQQTATSEVLKVISGSPTDLQPVLEAITVNSMRLCEADIGFIYVVEDGLFRVQAASGVSAEFIADSKANPVPVRPDRGTMSGRVVVERRAIHIPDVLEDSEYTSLARQRLAGYRAMLGAPMLRQGEIIGIIALWRKEPRPFTEKQVGMLERFADQAVIAVENTRLFNEIQDKSRQLEAASRHKSEFLANMSHELRTPLNAIIGFSDVLEQRLFGELNERQADYTRDIASSGRHLLDLVNEILDLSKVEAGRMELELSDVDLASTIHGALAFIRERAASHRIELSAAIPADLGTVVADERKLRQVLLNLLSNAVKFTPDGGRVAVNARRTDDEIQVSVQDTGIGIAPEDQPRVFEEFRQVGKTSDRSREGTGLGLTLAKRFIELHGGQIWIDSEVGKGTTFTFAIPVDRNVAAPA